MKTKDCGAYFRAGIIFPCLLSVVCCLWSACAFASDGWFEDAKGYTRGMNQAVTQQKPVIIYFYASWCGYCRKFEKNILADLAVREALNSFVKIRINAEAGRAENELAGQYGIGGFPTVFFKKPGQGQSAKEMYDATRSIRDFLKITGQFSEKKTISEMPLKKPAPSARVISPDQIIYLKSGRTVAGKIISEDEDGVTLATSELGDIYFSRVEIQNIEQAKK